MRIRPNALKVLIVPFAMAAASLLVMGTGSVAKAAEPMKIQVVMQNMGFKVSGHAVTGELASIVIRNEDTTTHGFTSPLLNDAGVSIEGEGVQLKGKGVNSIHVGPGKSATVTFTKHSKSEPETMRYMFWCDMHPQMKGEVFVVETVGEIGGG